MNSSVQIAFGLLGGLALFLFGMNMMSECLQKAAGEKNEINSGTFDKKKSDTWSFGRRIDHSSFTEQQCDNCYDDRIRQRRSDESATGNFYYIRC